MTADVGFFKSYQLIEGRPTPVSKQVSPTETIRAQIDALFDGSGELVEVIEDIARLGAQLIIQTAVEAEVTAFLGRARYERADGECSVGSRNGYQPATAIKTTAGPVNVRRPKLRGTNEPFVSALFGTGVAKSHALKCLVIASFVRGLSTRDVEAKLADALGLQGKISKSEVSRICKAIGDELDTWNSRLDNVTLDYLFLDASFFRYHVGAAAEPVLAAWGIDTDGEPVFVGLAASGSGESGDGWADFLTELGDRGLGCPLLVISDGAARPGQCRGAHHDGRAPPTLPHPSMPQHRREGPQARRRRHQGRLLGDLRPRRRHRTRSGDRRPGAEADRRLRSPLARLLPGRGQVPAHRPRQPHRLPPLPPRALDPGTALQVHRTHLWRDPSPQQGHRTPPR